MPVWPRLVRLDRADRRRRRHTRAQGPRFLPLLASYETGDDVGLELPYLPNGSLRTYLEKHHIDDSLDGDGKSFIPAWLRARWIVELVDGIGFLHQHDVIHCDIKPHNLVLDDTLGVRIIDLAGSQLGDGQATCSESTRLYTPRPPRSRATVTTDRFAVGMSLYEIVTGAQPYGELVDADEIDARYERGESPSLAMVTVPEDAEIPEKFVTKIMGTAHGNLDCPANTSAYARARAPADASGQEIRFAGIMRRCWHGPFASAADLLAALAEEIRVSFSAADVAYIEQASGLSLQEATMGSRLPDGGN